MPVLIAIIFSAVVSNNVEVCLNTDTPTVSQQEYCEGLKNNNLDANDFIVIDTIPNFGTIGM